MAEAFILFLVKRNETDEMVVIVTATGREYAKSKAFQFLRGDPDSYIVTPLTNEGDVVHFDLSVRI